MLNSESFVENQTIKLTLEKITSFSSPNKCNYIALGEVYVDIPHLVLICAEDILYIFNLNGQKESLLGWPSNITCIAIGDLKGTGDNNVVFGRSDGAIMVIDNSGELFWIFRLKNSIHNLSIGDLNGDNAYEVLATLEDQNSAVLLTNNGRHLWTKSFNYKIVSTSIGNLSKETPSSVILFSNEGSIRILDYKGELMNIFRLEKSITQGALLQVGNYRFFVTTHSNLLTIWEISEKLTPILQYEERANIQQITTGKIFYSDNDAIILLTEDNAISVLRVISHTYKESDNYQQRIEIVDTKIKIDLLRPLILRLNKSFGTSGIPLMVLYKNYLKKTKTQITYNRFYTDILDLQSDGKLGGRIDTFKTPAITKDDLLIISSNKFFCMSCNKNFPIVVVHHQCDQCLRFLCEECYNARKEVGFIECPFCAADSTHFISSLS